MHRFLLIKVNSGWINKLFKLKDENVISSKFCWEIALPMLKNNIHPGQLAAVEWLE